jgi:hypothetical protein
VSYKVSLFHLKMKMVCFFMVGRASVPALLIFLFRFGFWGRQWILPSEYAPEYFGFCPAPGCSQDKKSLSLGYPVATSGEKMLHKRGL